MIKKLILIFFIFLIGNSVFAEHLHTEKYYQEAWCSANNGIMEYTLQDKTRVDCLTQTDAIEFEFSKKWAEAIGQSLYYGEMTGRCPTIAMIIEKPSDNRYYYRILPLCRQHGIKIFRVYP